MPKQVPNSSNSELVMELLQVLEKEASLFETFLDLLEKQQQALVKNELDEINRLTELQRERVVESTILSRRREKLAERLASDGIAAGDLTISRLIETVSSGQAAELRHVKEAILELYEKIMKVRSQNEMLIDRSRENISQTMAMLGRIGKPDPNYRREGGVSPNDNALALDRRA